MLDHIGLKVTDLARSRGFYEAALLPLGITTLHVLTETDTGGTSELVGLGRDGKAMFWITEASSAGGPIHIAFAAGDRASVDAFHHAALAAGGRDNGGPGLRPHYHATYYGAFVLDPDGNNVEAVCHRPA